MSTTPNPKPLFSPEQIAYMEAANKQQMADADPYTARFLEGLLKKIQSWIPDRVFRPRRWGRFELRKDGVYADFEKLVENPDAGGAEKVIRTEKVCGYLEVASRSRDEHGSSWGKVLRWIDHEGRKHECSMREGLSFKGGTDLLELFANEGLYINRKNRGLIKEYLDAVATDKFTWNVPRTGWYSIPKTNTKVFILPDRVIGSTSNSDGVIFQPDSLDKNHARTSVGSLSDWQKNVSHYCIGNNILTFAVSAAFAAPILKLVDEPSGGFHLRNSSSKGKTSALTAGASVWGHKIGSWRTTDNALENTAESHNDMLLTLDELALLDSRVAGECAYMLANGDGKGRMNDSSGSQRKREWRLLFLSTGEISLTDHANDGGKKLKAGTEVRMVDINADAGKGFGCFEDIHGFVKDDGQPDPAGFADAIRTNAEKFRGTAGPMWIEYLITKEDAAMGYLKNLIAKFVDKFVPKEAQGEVRRVARRFAVVGAAGELATEAGFTGWPPGSAIAAAQWCFERWMVSRSLGASDIDKAIDQIRMFLFTNRNRFEDRDGISSTHIPNLVGYRKTVDGVVEFWIPKPIFDSEVCKGHDTSAVLQELKQRGWLQHDKDRNTKQQRIDGGQIRMYVIRGTIMEG